MNKTLKLIENYADAASRKYWHDDQGSPKSAAVASKDNDEAYEKMKRHILALQRKVKKLEKTVVELKK